MAGRKHIAITERQFEILQILWGHGPMTVRELMQHVPRGDRMPYTTVLGLLQNMEKAELLMHTEEGLTYRYEPTVSRQAATGELLSDFVSRFFRGSAQALVLGLMDTEQLSPEELRELEEKLGQTASAEQQVPAAAAKRSRKATTPATRERRRNS